MMVVKNNSQICVQDFLALDRDVLDQKYEFLNGNVVVLPGGTINHGTLINNISSLLYLHLRKSPCHVLSENTLKIEDDCYLPDIMVTCHEQDISENKTYVEHPKLVIEVLSPSTEKYDRMDKVWAYTQCSSIEEYLLVNWDVMIVQKMTRKGSEGPDQFQWIESFHRQGEGVSLATIDFSLPVNDVYEKVVLPPLEPFRRFRRRKTE